MPIRRDTPTYQLILDYRCPGCNGRGAVQQNPGDATRTMVMHSTTCRIRQAVELYFPKLYKNLEQGNVVLYER